MCILKYNIGFLPPVFIVFLQEHSSHRLNIAVTIRK